MTRTDLESKDPRTDEPRTNRSSIERERKRRLLDGPHIAPLSVYVEGLRESKADRAVPHFDPTTAGVDAPILVLLEAPSLRRCGRSSKEKDRLVPVLDQYEPLGSTDRIAFVTTKPCEPTTKSHISHVVADSQLEVGIAHELERDERVVAYAKNDRLFLEIPYRYLGRTLRYRPDFIVKLGNGRMVLIEAPVGRTKRKMRRALPPSAGLPPSNAWGKLGKWSHYVCIKESEVVSALDEAVE